MQSLRLRVKEEFTLVCAGDVAGVNKNLILRKGEEYDVNMRGVNGRPVIYVKDEEYDMLFDKESEFWEYMEFAPMSELDFREIFDADNDTMRHVKEDIRKGFYSGYYDCACLRMLESELDTMNLSLNENVLTSESVIEYIMMMREDDTDTCRYTLKDWVRDTKESQPECFVH